MDLEQVIQSKKESKDFVSIKMGLITEMDCFNAIELLGSKKFSLKEKINNLLKENYDPNSSEIKILIAEANETHYMQSLIVNDVCSRFEVIHPQMSEKLLTEELLQKKQRYWDWYKYLYKKKYGKEPEII